MFRDSLEENKGMLFIYNNEDYLNFWMKNTNFPLDIIFISSNMTVVDIRTMEPCIELFCKTYESRKPAKYALEINQGLAKKLLIEVGYKVELII